MASSTKHNPAAHDPAVLYWDWEKIKIMNRPPGPPGPQQLSCDNENFMHPRSGTLKRSNAFAGSKATQPVGDDGFKNAGVGMKKYEESSPEASAKLEFPETLYSEAKRRAVEDMGSRFMRTIQKLDRGGLKEPVDFNSILERHWAELAEFYSAQVSTVRKLEQKLKATTTSSLGGLPPASPPQLPPYLMSQLSELKLHPFVFAKSEKKSDLPSYLESEESNHLVEEYPTTGSLESKPTEEKACVTPDVKGVQDLIQWSHGTPHCEETKEFTTANLHVTDSPPTEETHGTVHNGCRKSDQSVVGKETPKGVHMGPELGPEFPREVESATECQIELGRYSPDKAAETNLAKHIQLVDPEVARSMNTSKLNGKNSPNRRGVDGKENSQRTDIEKTEDQDPGRLGGTTTAYPMSSYLIENYKTLAEVMKLVAMNPDEIDETYSETTLNFHPVEINTDRSYRTGRVEDGSIPSFPQSYLQSKLPLPQFTGTTIQDEVNPEGVTGKHVQHEDMYRFGSADTSGTIDFFISSGETLKTDSLSKVEFPADMLYDTLVFTPGEITPEKSGVTLTSLDHPATPSQGQIKVVTENAPSDYLDVAVAESLPHDSNNDYFSVSDDSYLFCGSTGDELEKLQMEVKDHLEQAERQGGMLVARWVDESGIKRVIDELDKEAGVNNLAENQEELNGNGEEGCEEEDIGEDERIEIFEFEYVDDGEDSEDEDGEIDQEMEKILAWIALEDAKVEAAVQSNQAMVKFDGGRIEEVVETNDSDDREEIVRKEETVVATRVVVEKELSVVNEEDEDDDEAVEEANKGEGCRKAVREEFAGEDTGDERGGYEDDDSEANADSEEAEAEEVIMVIKKDKMEVSCETRGTEAEEAAVEITEEKLDDSVRTGDEPK